MNGWRRDGWSRSGNKGGGNWADEGGISLCMVGRDEGTVRKHGEKGSDNRKMGEIMRAESQAAKIMNGEGTRCVIGN